MRPLGPSLSSRDCAGLLLAAVALLVTGLFGVVSGCQDPLVERKDAPVPVAPDRGFVALSAAEYNNAIRDLFGFEDNIYKWPKITVAGKKVMPPWPWALPAEARIEGFEELRGSQKPSPWRVERLQQAAAVFARLALDSPSFFVCERACRAACAPSNKACAAGCSWLKLEETARTTCAWKSVADFAARARRRPLSDADSERLHGAFTEHRGHVALPDAITLAVAGILQTQRFLYRIEDGVPGKGGSLDSWDVAARLAFFLWDSVPDDALRAAAQDGTLATADGVEKQARRMLKDPRARAAVVRFHEQWLGIDDLHGVRPSRAVYGPVFGFAPTKQGQLNDFDWPNAVAMARQSMYRELQLFIERTVFDGAGSFTALMRDNHGYLSAATAPIYGADVKVAPGKPVLFWTRLAQAEGHPKDVAIPLYAATFPANERAGVLTMPAVLAAHAHAVHPSPILRGKFVLERLACETMTPPPPGAEAAGPADVVDTKRTNRERTEDATGHKPCSQCHDRLNPPGFALENYDAIGRWRDKDAGKNVDATATFGLRDGELVQVHGAVELSAQLAASRQVRACYVKRWAAYAAGEHVDDDDGDLVAVQKTFDKHDDVRELIVAIVRSRLFRDHRGAP